MNTFGNVIFRHWVLRVYFCVGFLLSFDWEDISNTQSSDSRSLFQTNSPNNSFSWSSSNELCIIILTCSLMFGNVMKCCLSCFTYYFKLGESFLSFAGQMMWPLANSQLLWLHNVTKHSSCKTLDYNATYNKLPMFLVILLLSEVWFYTFCSSDWICINLILVCQILFFLYVTVVASLFLRVCVRIITVATSVFSFTAARMWPHHDWRVGSSHWDQAAIVICPADICHMRRMADVFLKLGILTLDKRIKFLNLN